MSAEPRHERAADSEPVQMKQDLQHVEIIQTLQDPDDQRENIFLLLLHNWRIVVFTTLANCGSMLFGYDVLVQGAITALPAFSMYYGDLYEGSYILPAGWQGAWGALNAIGIMFGAAGNGFLQDKLGRRVPFMIGGLISCASTAVAYVSPFPDDVNTRRGLLLLAKTILGVAMGICMSSCQTYVSEVSPPKLRTVLLGFYPFLLTLAQMIAIVVVFSNLMDFTPRAFQIPFAGQWAFGGLAVCVAMILPQSPVHFMARNEPEAARKTLQKLHGAHAAVDQRLEMIRTTIEAERREAETMRSATFADCFKGSNLRRTRIVAVLNSLQQFIGVSLVNNSTYFFIMSGMTATQSLTITKIGVGMSMICSVLCWVIMLYLGRRTAILGSFVAAGLMYLGMGIAGCFTSSQPALRFVAAALLVSACMSNLGVGTAYPIVAAEIPSVRLRSKTVAIGFAVNAFMTEIFTVAVPYMFNVDNGNLGGKIGFVFFGGCIIGFVLSWFEIPEIKNLSYAQIDYLFQTNTPTRNFKKAANTLDVTDAVPE